MIYLGIDSGTQSVKAIALDLETGKILASGSAPHKMISGLPEGHLEQHPESWTTAADNAVRACLAGLGDAKSRVSGIGVSGQQHGLVVLDKDDNPVRPAKLWCDTSTVPQCEMITRELGGVEEIIALCGNAMLPGYTAPKILWIKQNEPRNYPKIRSILLPHDYLNFWLTGEKSMEYGDASGTALMDVRKREWSKDVMAVIDPDLPEKLPQPGSSKEPVGLLRESLRTAWGLSGTPLISAGGGDNMMGAIGTGNVASGIVTASLGTSGTLYAFSETPVIDPKGEVAAFCDSTDHWLPLVCTMNVTVATEQARNLFNWSHEQMEQAIANAPAGAGGLLFLPYLQGERTPNLPKARGALHGLTTANMTQGGIARSVMEGVTLGLAYGLERLKELGIAPAEIRMTGGGANSRVWRQICADIFGVPVVGLISNEGAALGAAIQAAWTHRRTERQTADLRELTGQLAPVDPATRCEPGPDQKVYADRLRAQTRVAAQLHAGGLL